MMKFSFHHFFVCNSIPKFSGKIVVDPAVLEALDGGDAMAGLAEGVDTSTGSNLKDSSEFVLRDAKALKRISERFEYVFFVVSDKNYHDDCPSWSSDGWDSCLRLEDMTMLGWTVYAFAEPALLHGVYPASIDGAEGGFDEKYINQWGLIRNEALAQEVVDANNEPTHENKGHWRMLGIYVDQETHARLLKIL